MKCLDDYWVTGLKYTQGVFPDLCATKLLPIDWFAEVKAWAATGSIFKECKIQNLWHNYHEWSGSTSSWGKCIQSRTGLMIHIQDRNVDSQCYLMLLSIKISLGYVYGPEPLNDRTSLFTTNLERVSTGIRLVASKHVQKSSLMCGIPSRGRVTFSFVDRTGHRVLADK